MLVRRLIKQNANFFPTYRISPFTLKTKQIYKLKVTARGIKSVEHNGGIDNYILNLKAKITPSKL